MRVAEGTTLSEMITARTCNLAAQVIIYAHQHYEQGWDVVVETMTQEDVEDIIGRRVRTLHGALDKLRPYVDVHNDRIADARNSAF